MNINLNMNEYVEDLRPLFEMLVSEMTAKKLPEGKFALTVSMEDMNSYPDVKLEDVN